MVRTQIQLPDELYAELKAFAASKEWSLAETMRRAAENLLSSYPRHPDPHWKLPEPAELGELLAPEEDWRELANQREP